MYSVGDIVKTREKGNGKYTMALVTRVENGCLSLLFADGSVGNRIEESVKRVGGRIMIIENVMRMILIKGGEAGEKST